MTWIDVDSLATATQRTPNNLRVLAHRHHWDRITRNGRTLYSLTDATDTLLPLHRTHGTA